jgi:hypothetical protein
MPIPKEYVLFRTVLDRVRVLTYARKQARTEDGAPSFYSGALRSSLSKTGIPSAPRIGGLEMNVNRSRLLVVALVSLTLAGGLLALLIDPALLNITLAK